MSPQFSRGRRFAIALVALALAAVLFRRQIADALVIRGDDYLYRGDAAAALERYRRALSIDPISGTAADRYAFVSIRNQTVSSLEHGIAVATKYLQRRPHDAAVLMDRALCYLHERRYAAAQADFENAAQASNSAEAYVFAGWAAKHAGQRRAALGLWTRALSADPKYRPAIRAISENTR